MNSLIYYDLLTGATIRSVSSVETLRPEYFDEEIPEGQGRIFAMDVHSIIGKMVVDGALVDDPSAITQSRLDNRVQLLASTDWYSIRHRDQVDLKVPTSLTESQYGQLLSYRQQLRDWTDGAFPSKPEWML